MDFCQTDLQHAHRQPSAHLCQYCMAPPTSQRTRLTVQQKLEIAEDIRAGVNHSTLATKYNVGSRTVRRIKKNEHQLRKTVSNAAISSAVKTVRTAQFAKIDRHLMQFVQFCRQARKPVTLATLSYRALRIRDKLLLSESDARVKRELEKFCASKNWCLAFTKRHALRSQSLHGEAGSVNALAVAGEISQLRSDLAQYPPDHIYNMDETGLFFKLLPRRTYVLESEGRRTVRGIKAMKAKDRITAFVCTNADGSQKVDMSIIGKAQNPRCFRMGKPHVPYFSQKNAWADNVVFKRWFSEVFLPHVRKTTSRPVALVMDNCGPHGADISDSRGQVAIYPLPPNCTALHQPMDLGVIAAWKAHYRRNLLVEMMEDIENQQARRDQNRKRPAGMKGLADGYDAHMLDVSRLCQKSWSEVTPEAIARCWTKSGILSMSDTADLVQSSGKLKRSQRECAVLSDILGMFQKISLEARSVLLQDSDIADVDQTTVEQWMDVEMNDDVQDGMIEDATVMDDVGMASPGVEQENEGEDMDEDDDSTNICAAPIPSSTAVTAMFADLEEMSYNCNLPEVAVLLRRAKREVDEVRAKRSSSVQPRQMLLTELWAQKSSLLSSQSVLNRKVGDHVQ